jgi:hypothetical protein
VSLITAHSDVDRLSRSAAKPRALPVGFYWLAALMVSLGLWALLIRSVVWLLA